ncbi:MAG TPA: M20 family metallopeptidase [Methylomirabilota bacterium]|nr:M20 family metallopeptidase [Methylomirabilota bacterium]
MSLKDVLAHIETEEVVALTRDLVRIPSVIRPGDPSATEAAVADYVHQWLAKEGFDVEVHDVAPGRPNVLAVLGEKGAGKSVLLEGHTDVVTEGDAAQWTHPPFGADLVDGRIYGRGAADMKSGLAAAMVAAAAFKRSNQHLGGRLVVGALVDEEGDMIGAHHLCTTAIGRELDAAIICEPEENELCLEQRGVVWARVTVRGRMAHGAMPEAGVNPITGVGALLREVPALEKRLRKLCTKSRYLRPPTVTPTIVKAPVQGVPQPNVIPATAEATLDIRLTPGPDADGVAAEIEAACRRAATACPDATLEWRPLNGYRLATRVDKDEALVRAMMKGVRQATGKAPRFGGVPGSTDGTILRTTLGIPIVTCGPGNRLIPHQVDEYVEVAELVEAARIYVASVFNYLGLDGPRPSNVRGGGR